MLSIDLLYAVLQGLPSAHLQHLDHPWRIFCRDVEQALKGGQPPVAALRFALENSLDWQVTAIKKALAQASVVRQLSKLSHRQKELLVALRVAQVASLSQLCCSTLQDKGHAHRRLQVLVQHGHALKFYKPGGVFYMAVNAPISRHARSEVNSYILQLMNEIEGASQ